MKTHIKRIKKINEAARIIGLDIGRKYTGVALSNRDITESKGYKTLIGKP